MFPSTHAKRSAASAAAPPREAAKAIGPGAGEAKTPRKPPRADAPRRVAAKRSHANAPARQNAGFTFIELLVVITILGVITTGVIPIFNASMHMIQAKNWRLEFVALLAFVQEKAVADSTEYRFYIDNKNNTYWVEALIGREDGDKVFAPIEEEYARLKYIPAYMRLSLPRMRQDRDRRAYYIGCYPNGGCDRVELSFRDQTDRRRRFTVETLGVMGKIKVDIRN